MTIEKREEKDVIELNAWFTEGTQRVRMTRVMPAGSDIERGLREMESEMRRVYPGAEWRLMSPEDLRASPGPGDDVVCTGCWVSFLTTHVGDEGDDNFSVDAGSFPLNERDFNPRLVPLRSYWPAKRNEDSPRPDQERQP